MKVFKFGGASVETAERIQNVSTIIQTFTNEPLVVVISAIGKTTNALEKIATSFFDGKQQEALQLFQQLKEQHNNISLSLLKSNTHKISIQLQHFY